MTRCPRQAVHHRQSPQENELDSCPLPEKFVPECIRRLNRHKGCQTRPSPPRGGPRSRSRSSRKQRARPPAPGPAPRRRSKPRSAPRDRREKQKQPGGTGGEKEEAKRAEGARAVGPGGGG